MPGDREAIRSNAKYLRQVRPIDPEEIAEYVEGHPDPRVVRQILREEALDLDLAERPDGTFVPAAEGPYRPVFDGVGALPDRYEEALTDLLVDRYGPMWPDGESGSEIRARIERLKSDYYRQHPVEYDLDVALAYAIYHLADYYASTQHVLADMARDGLLPTRIRVLDVGAGVGGPALGLHEFYTLDDPDPDTADIPVVEYDAVEPSEAATVLEELLGAVGRNFHWSVHRERAQSFEPSGEYDLILFSNVVSEMAAPADVLESYLGHLAEDGSLLLTAPADRNTSIQLRAVERDLESRGVTVYGPTVRLWPGERPTEVCWSFDRKPDIEPPAFQRALAEGVERADTFLNTSIKYSYSILRTDGRRRHDVDLDRGRFAKMAGMDDHVSNRLDLVAAKLSQNLAEEGHPLFKISDGSESENHFAVLVNETELNRALREAEYGDLLVFEQVLALWNDDEEAFNLVVDETTVVDRMPR